MTIEIVDPAAAGPVEAPAASADRRRRRRAIAMMCAATLCFAGIDTSAKLLSGVLPSVEVVWARYLAAAIFGLIAVQPLSRPAVLRSRRPLMQIGRSMLLLVATLANFLALRQLQLAETSTINFLSPLFVVLLAGPLLGEWPGRARLGAVAIGFAAILLALRPGTSAFQPVAGIAIAGVLVGAGYPLLTRVLARSDPSETTLAWTPIAGVALLTPLLPLLWVTPPNLATLAIIAAMGVFAGLGHWLLILAHHRAPAPILAPFAYTQLIWMIGSGLLVFGDAPSGSILLGAGVVIGCGLYLIWRERGKAPAR
jgi:drug/metabolite transporter (DMT)-like permease